MKTVKSLLVVSAVALVQLYSNIFEPEEVKVAPKKPQLQAAGPVDMMTLFKRYECNDPVVQDLVIQKLTSQSQRKVSKHFGRMAEGVAYGLRYELGDIVRRGVGESEGHVVCEAQSTITSSTGKQRSLALIYRYRFVGGKVVSLKLLNQLSG